MSQAAEEQDGHLEAQLRASRQALASIINAAGAVIVILGLDHRILEFNPEAERLYGVKREEVLGRDYFESFLPRDVRPQVRADMNKVLRGRKTQGFENSVRAKNGTERVLSWSVSRLADAQDRPTGVLAIGQDISKRIRAEEELARNRDRQLAMNEAIPDLIFRLDANGVFLDVKLSKEIAPYVPPEQFLGKKIPDVLPPKVAEISMRYLKRALESRQTESYEYQLPVGNEIWDFEGRIAASGSDQAVAVIRNITESKQAKVLNDALNEVNLAINSTLDFNEILQKVIVESAAAIGSESALVLLREGGRWTVKNTYGPATISVGTSLTDDEAKALTLATKNTKPVVVNDAFSYPVVDQLTMKTYGLRSFVVVQLIVKETVIGSLLFVNHTAARTFSESQIDFLSKLAASVSLALENARLYAEQQRIADTLQRALLKMPERLPGIEFSFIYRSATAERAEVGGDFYDLIELDHQKLGILIGDVSGKGLEAATTTSLVKNTVRGFVYEHGSPSITMTKVNYVLHRTSEPSTFVTAFFGILDLETGDLTYSNAGHPPALIVKKDGAHPALLAMVEPVMGVFSDLSYTDHQARLEEGDVLLVYTDGVLEARRDNEFFGADRLIDAVRASKPEQASKLPQLIFNRIASFTSGPLADDIAIVALWRAKDKD